MLSNDKIAAIYDLRRAVEAKARAENAYVRVPTPETHAALVDACRVVEAKTRQALDVCHICDHEPGGGANAAPRR